METSEVFGIFKPLDTSSIIWILTAIDSSEQYIIGKTQDFVGVYNINNGYTVFVRVNILESTDEYYIVKQGDIYGLSLYDRIVLDGSTVSENQIIFQ